jgi:hypothetical protein
MRLPLPSPAPVTDLTAGAEALRRWRCGAIDVERGEVAAVRRRLWPKRVSRWGSQVMGERVHRRQTGDFCRLYYHEPLCTPDFIVLSYVVSHRDTSFATFRRAVFALEQIANLRDAYALVCDATNERISDRLLARWGWEQHAYEQFGRNFIKRLRPFEPHVVPFTPMLAQHSRSAARRG